MTVMFRKEYPRTKARGDSVDVCNGVRNRKANESLARMAGAAPKDRPGHARYSANGRNYPRFGMQEQTRPAARWSTNRSPIAQRCWRSLNVTWKRPKDW